MARAEEGLNTGLLPCLPDSIEGTLTSLEKARLNVLLAYSLETYLYVILKMTGHPTKDHVVMRDLSQIRSYLQKIKAVEGGNVGKSEHRVDDMRSSKVDKEAAGRFIKNALGQSNDKTGTSKTWESNSESSSEDESDDESESESGSVPEVASPVAPAQPPMVIATAPPPSRKRKAIDPFAGYSDIRSSQ